MLRTYALAAAAAGFLLHAAPADAKRTTEFFTSITVFGDSLVDAGNISVATGGAVPNPALGYFQGRFTNGYNYTDLLSLQLYGTPTVASLAGGRSYAYGGARVVDTGDTTPDLGRQLQFYFAALGTAAADGNALHIMNFGGNDIFGANNNSIGSFGSVDAYLRAAARQYAQGVADLDARGARNILLTGFPVATSPFSFTAEGYLTQELAALSLNADTTLYRYDYLSFFNRVTTNPAAFGLPPLNLTTTCIQAGAQASDCAGYFSFDGTHPTAAIQRAAYQDMNRQFNLTGAIPEPSTWLMMVLGFGMIGAAIRRRGGVPALA